MNLSDKKTVKHIIFILTYVIVLYLILSNLNDFKNTFLSIINIATPFILGFGIAFIINILMKFIENKLFSTLNKKNNKVWNKLKRPFSIILSFIFIILFISGLITFLIPQVADSIHTFAKNLPTYMATFTEFSNQIINQFDLKNSIFESLLNNWQLIVQKIGDLLSNILPYFVNFTIGLTSGLFNFIMALIIAIYMLGSKETLCSGVKKLIFAFFPLKQANYIMEVGVVANKSFSGFLSSQLIEAFVQGALCSGALAIMGVPYPLLIGVITGITGVIPVFGAFFGAIPSFFIILMADYKMAFAFIIFIIIFQQVDGNLIYPRIVGDSVGLSALWVLFAMLIGGSLFGFPGMLLGIPTFNVFYIMLKRATYKQLEIKKIEID